jgi:pSer/pThr/pTyr-binding forkhead associated (FHA) protein
MSAEGSDVATREGLRLEVVSGNAGGFEICVADRLVIGRNSEGPGRLAGDPELSRHHAEISRDDSGTYLIEDLASTNGTVVNGSRISSPTPLATGDSIHVGTTSILVVQVPAESDQRPPVDVRAATVTVEVPAPIRAAAPRSPAAEAATPSPAAELPAEPEPAASEEPTEEHEPGAEPAAPRLALLFDPQNAELEIRLDDTTEPVRVALSEGRWQVRPG